MRFTELMINDWVYVDWLIKGNFQVTGIDKLEMQTAATSNYMGHKYAHPIPVTPEILEANGFYKAPKDESENIDKPDVWVYEKEDKVIVIGLKEGEFASFEIYNDRRYASFTDRLCGVSELQHAMRMMGLHELADNFKIKEGGQQ